jgi:hypothetical protein
MGSYQWVLAPLCRTLAAKGRSNSRKRGSAPWAACRPVAEALEGRLVLASAAGVEDVLLPKFIAQIGDSGNQLPTSDAWWALRSQRNMAIDEPVSKVLNIGGHNAFNAINEGFDIVRFFAPNQVLSMRGQLDVGARLIEFDIHDPRELDFSLTRNLILKHGPGPTFLTRLFPYDLDDALAEVTAWLARPENRNEVVYLDIEDATDQSESGADDPLIPKLERHLGSMIYTPDERAADGRWPSRAELVGRGKRVVIFTHRNDADHGRFGAPVGHVDPNGHAWYGASLAFRANGGEDPVADRGNFHQARVDQVGTVPSEDANVFFATQSDGIRVPGSAPRHTASDVRRDARLNVDFIKMDFLFTDDEDSGLGNNVLPTNDPFYDAPEGNRIELLENAVWSWATHDPAVDRQMFQDLTPGDGTGFATFRLIEERLDFATAQNLAEIGVAARGNGRDVAVQDTEGRWESVAPTSATPLRFAARSVTANAAGEFDWALTTAASTNWFDGPAFVRDEFGSGFIFAGPVNGFQNAALAAGDAAESVWMNVQDLDRDGNWGVNANRAPTVTSVTVQPATTDEGASVQLTVEFVDDHDGHTVEIDWGDGSVPTIVAVAAQDQQEVVVSYVYQDDHPATGTPSDNLTINVTVTDAGGLSAVGTTAVTVNNAPPVIGSFASDATFADTAAEGTPVSILANFSDAGVRDTHAAVVDWGDGSAPEAVTVHQGAGSGTVIGSHPYAVGGIYTITVSLTDDDTGAAAVTTTAVVRGVGLLNGTLFVIGGGDNDNVGFNRTGKGELRVRSGIVPDKWRAFDAAQVERIIAYLGAGDDHLSLANQAAMPAVIHGGAGDDHLIAGGGPTALLGDDGDDTLIGHVGRNILVGGAGKDRLGGGTSGDVLIGGRTSADQDDNALLAATAAWDAPAIYLVRASAIAAAIAVNDDGDPDKLTGGRAQDLFYAGAGDILNGVKRDERVLQ